MQSMIELDNVHSYNEIRIKTPSEEKAYSTLE